LRKNENYKVEVKSYADRARNVVLWKRGRDGWIWQQSMPIPAGIDGDWLEADVLRRLS
jgi:hypothetical protein